ncbi:hypothetical protein ACFFX0_21340 [Citricoccus parietis]|uniref:Uncharacterized protein n=1 Tax=Citricoccus parietis TaxID=592307 RepID=A0ABV5G3T8_9MICC
MPTPVTHSTTTAAWRHCHSVRRPRCPWQRCCACRAPPGPLTTTGLGSVRASDRDPCSPTTRN